MKTVVIGTRGSRLARTQSEAVRRALKKRHPSVDFKVSVVETRGDRDKSLSVFDHSGTGVFTREIEKLLLEGKVDIAVHSLKDLPTKLPRGLCIGAYAKRADPRDVLLTRRRQTMEDLPRGATVGTSSPRRETQIRLLRPDIRVLPLRGNLDTRVRKVVGGQVDAIVVAKAGLDRLGGYGKFFRVFAADEILPAVSQGVLGIEVRARDARIRRLVAAVNHGPTEREARAERALLAALEGGCRVPIGALARAKGARLTLEAVVCPVKAGDALRAGMEGPAARPEELGRRLAKAFIDMGAKRLIRDARAR